MIMPCVCQESGKSAVVSASDNEFWFEAKGIPLWQLAQSISEYFNVNILVFDDVKEKKIHGDIKGLNIEETLNALTWLIGIEWIKKDNVYYVGGNATSVSVYKSIGIDSKIETVYKDSVKLLGDKIVVQGSERDIKKIEDSLKKVTERDFVKVKVKMVEISYNDEFDVGFEWSKAFEYTADWKEMLKNIHPVTHAAMAIAVSTHLDEIFYSSRTLINTELGILSGSGVSIAIGEDLDREVYQQSDYGTRVVSGYNTQHTGLIIDLKAFKGDSKDWVLHATIENSTSESSLQKRLTKLTNQIKASSGDVVLIGSVKRENIRHEVTKGIPFLCRIPWLGLLFGVHKDITLTRDVYAVLLVE